MSEANTMSKEAMTLALEALEDISQMQNHSNSGDSSDVDKAIKALEEALALEQEQRSVSEQLGEPVAWVCYGAVSNDIDFEQDDIDALPVGTMLYTTPYVPTGRQPAQKPYEHLAMQVRPSEFAELIKGKETVTGIPAYWAEWPNKENT